MWSFKPCKLRSSHSQGKGGTFYFSVIFRPQVLGRPLESNPRSPALQSTAVQTGLILLAIDGLIEQLYLKIEQGYTW